MLYRVLTDVVVVVHILFVLFAVAGGLLLLRSKRFAWIHLPAAIWAMLVEMKGWMCPLTPLENFFREKSGEMGYKSGFIEHYFFPLLYPEVLTRRVQILLGVFVLVINVGIYGWVLSRIFHEKT
ncbi:DUF2784 domain-containing protein [Thermodesulfobacteriota bacterium]